MTHWTRIGPRKSARLQVSCSDLVAGNLKQTPYKRTYPLTECKAFPNELLLADASGVLGTHAGGDHRWTRSGICVPIRGKDGIQMKSWFGAILLKLRGAYRLRQKRYEAAFACYREIAEGEPENAIAFCLAGYCLVELGRGQEAVAMLDRALQIRPDYSDAHSQLSRALDQLGETEAALEYAQRAVRNDARRDDPKRAAKWNGRIGYFLSKRGDWASAVEYLRLASQERSDAVVYDNLALAFWNSGDKEGCVDTYRAAILLNPRDADVHYGLGWALYNLLRYEEAVEPLRRAIQLAPAHADAYHHLGVVLTYTGHPDEGLDALRRAATLRHDHAETHYWIGRALEDKGDWEGVVSAHRQATSLDPNHADAYVNLGVAYSKLGRSEEEIEAFKSAIRIDDKHALAWGNLALAYSEREMHQEALEAYEKLCELQPENEMGHYGVALSLGNLERFEEAVPKYQRAIELDPTFVIAHEYLGYIYLLMDRFSEAIACYERAMELAPGSAQLHAELADIYEKMGNSEEERRLRELAEELERRGNDPVVAFPKKPIVKEPAANSPGAPSTELKTQKTS